MNTWYEAGKISVARPTGRVDEYISTRADSEGKRRAGRVCGDLKSPHETPEGRGLENCDLCDLELRGEEVVLVERQKGHGADYAILHRDCYSVVVTLNLRLMH
jgi:hypothetical protein